jgi:hypothetical protein
MGCSRIRSRPHPTNRTVGEASSSLGRAERRCAFRTADVSPGQSQSRAPHPHTQIKRRYMKLGSWFSSVDGSHRNSWSGSSWPRHQAVGDAAHTPLSNPRSNAPHRAWESHAQGLVTVDRCFKRSFDPR